MVDCQRNNKQVIDIVLKMIKQKKGLGFMMVFLITLIVVVGSYFAISSFTNPVVASMRSGGASSVCTLSLYQGKGIARCPIDEVKIFKDEVGIKYGYKEYSDDEDYDKLVEIRSIGGDAKQDDTNAGLAKLLQDCMGRGGGLNSLAFSRDSWFGRSIVCLECAELTIDERAGVITGLPTYLNTEAPVGSVSGKTYVELLTRDDQQRLAYNQLGEKNGFVPGNPDFTFFPGEDYTVFFLGIKKNSGSVRWGQFLDLKDLDFDKALFENHDNYFTYISKSSDLGKVCDRKVN